MKILIIFVCLLFPSFLYAQKFAGKVSDKETGLPLTFVSVAISGTPIGVVTDNNGNFSIHIDNNHDQDSLKFSYVGYKTLSIKVLDFKKRYSGKKCSLYLTKNEIQLQEVKIKGKRKHNWVRLKGNVSNPTERQITFWYYSNPILLERQEAIADLDSMGNFDIEFEIDRARFVRLDMRKTGDFSIFLTPEDNLFIEFDAFDKINTIKFRGSGMINNNILPELFRFKHAFYKAWRKFEQMNAFEYRDTLLHYMESELKILSEYSINNKCTLEFYRLVYHSIRLRYLPHLLSAKYKLPLSSDYYSFLNYNGLANELVRDSFNVSHSDIVCASFYVSLFSKKKTAIQTGIEYYNDAKQVLKGKMRDYFLGWKIINSYNKEPHVWDSIYNEFRATCVYTEVLSFIEEPLLAMKDPVIPKKVLKETKLYTTSGKETTLNGLFKQFSGQTLYINIWSGYSPNCLQEFPFSSDLKKKLAGQPIKFLFLSVENLANWKKTVKKYRLMNDDHYLLPQSLGSSFCKRYLVGNVPRYFIISPDGKILNVNAPRPSEPDTYDVLLNKKVSFSGSSINELSEDSSESE